VGKTNGISEKRKSLHHQCPSFDAGIDVIPNDPSPTMSPLIKFAVCTEARSSDLVTLRWSDTDVSGAPVLERKENV
jgi:hypothetical protein